MALPAEVDWTALSSEGRDTLQQIALRVSLGFNHHEIAAALGVSQTTVAQRLRDLRAEIRAQAEST